MGLKLEDGIFIVKRITTLFQSSEKMETNHGTILLIPRWIAILKEREREKGIKRFLLEELHSNWVLYYWILNILQDVKSIDYVLIPEPSFHLIYTNNIFYDNKMLGMMIPNNDLISLLINKNFPDDEVLKSG